MSKVGTQLDIEIRNSVGAGEVVVLPFVPSRVKK
jgi:hypothetical protein